MYMMLLRSLCVFLVLGVSISHAIRRGSHHVVSARADAATLSADPHLHASSNTTYVSYNIHVEVGPNVLTTAMGINKCIRTQCPHEGIVLGASPLQHPHVSLYITNFNNASVGNIQTALSQLSTLQLPACNITMWNKIQANGTYAMWGTELPACLQYLSDWVVNATSPFMQPNQPIPPWVTQLPEPARSEKIAMIKKYGSPNVFSQFVPHVTVGFDNTTADNLAYWAPECGSEYLPHTPFTFSVASIAMAITGDYGTVSLPARVAVYPYPDATGQSIKQGSTPGYHAGDSTSSRQEEEASMVVHGLRERARGHRVGGGGNKRHVTGK